MYFYIFPRGAAHGIRVMVPRYGASRSHSLDTPHSVELLWTSGQPDAETLPDNTQHSQETDIRAPRGIQTGSPSK